MTHSYPCRKQEGLMSWREFAILVYEESFNRIAVSHRFCGRGDSPMDGEPYIITQQTIDYHRFIIILNLKTKTHFFLNRLDASTLESFEKELFYFFVNEGMGPLLEVQPDMGAKVCPVAADKNCLRDYDVASEQVDFDGFVQFASRNIFTEGRIDFCSDNQASWYQLVGLSIDGTKVAFCAAHDGYSKVFKFVYSDNSEDELNEAALSVALTKYLEKDAICTTISVMPALARKLGPATDGKSCMSVEAFLAYLAKHFNANEQALEFAGNVIEYAIEMLEDYDERLDFLCRMFGGLKCFSGITPAELSQIDLD